MRLIGVSFYSNSVQQLNVRLMLRRQPASEGLPEKGLFESGLIAAPLGIDRDPQQPGNIVQRRSGWRVALLHQSAIPQLQ